MWRDAHIHQFYSMSWPDPFFPPMPPSKACLWWKTCSHCKWEALSPTLVSSICTEQNSSSSILWHHRRCHLQNILCVVVLLLRMWEPNNQEYGYQQIFEHHNNLGEHLNLVWPIACASTTTKPCSLQWAQASEHHNQVYKTSSQQTVTSNEREVG